MVSISHERAVETERRLVAVSQDAVVTHCDGAWSFVRCHGPCPAEALAAVRDADGWCVLVPAPGHNRNNVDTFSLTLIVFAAGIDNSGFVGWLASTIKRELGAGVFVICGDNPRRGGIYDYWGYPVQIADQVRALIDRLRVIDSAPSSLDLRVFEVAATSPASVISTQTTFEFRERDGQVEASYSGGDVVCGRILGRRKQDASLDAAFVQLHSDGQLKTGVSSFRVEQLGGSRLRLVEEFTWADGGRGQNVLESVGR